MTSEQASTPVVNSTEDTLNNNTSTTTPVEYNTNNASTSSAKNTTPSSLPNTPVTNNSQKHYQQHYHNQSSQQNYKGHYQYNNNNNNNNNNINTNNNMKYNNHYQNFNDYENYDNYNRHNNNNNNNGNNTNNTNGNHHNNNHRMNNNMNRHNNNNNNNNYKKNYRHMQGHPMYNGPPGSVMPIPMQMPMDYGYYQMPYGIPQQNDTIKQGLPEKPITSPVKKHVPLVIKTKDGTPVSFTPSHAKRSSISTAPATVNPTATTKTTTTSTTASTNTTTTTNTNDVKSDSNTVTTEKSETNDESKPKVNSLKLQFQLQFQEQLRLKAQKKNALPAATTEKPTESSKPAAESSTAPETTTSIDSTLASQPSISTTKDDTIPTKSIKSDSTEENNLISEEKKQEVTEETTASTPATTETAVEKDIEQSVEKHQEPVEETENKTEIETEAESNEDETVKQFTMTEFFDKIQNAKVIADPFHFKYPENINGPDSSLESRKVLSYDPVFLCQFDKIQYKIDDAWRAKYLSKIYIPDKNDSRDKSFRGGRDSRSRSNGPLKGIPIRGEFEGRNNSRTGSKKKGRDGRERSKRGNDREMSRRSRGNKGERGEKGEKAEEKPAEIKIPPEEVKLEKATNRWVPKSQKQTAKEVKYAPDGVTVIYDDDDLQKKVRSLLNKLSLEKFDPISDEIIALANQSKWETDGNALKRVVELTFAKATDEPHWSAMYAKLCQKLVKDIDSEIYSEEYPLAEPQGEDKYFKGTKLAYRVLVLRCQTEYEKGWSTDLPTNEDGSPIEPELMSDEYYALAAQKRRGLGLVRFIGELYRLRLIRYTVIVGCIRILTSKKAETKSSEEETTEEETEDYLPQEDTLETLNQFLLTVGEPLEIEVPKCIEFAFQCISDYTKNPKIGSRIKYTFLDLIDLRKAKWRNADSKLAGPKTISQIHAEFNKNQSQQERERNDRSRSNKSGSKWGNDHLSSSEVSRVGMIRKGGENSMNMLRKGKSNASMGRMASDFTTVQSRSKSSRGPAPTSSRAAPNTNVNSSTKDSGEERQQSTNIFDLLNDDEHHSHEEEDEEDVEEEEENVEEAEGEDSGSVEVAMDADADNTETLQAENEADDVSEKEAETTEA